MGLAAVALPRLQPAGMEGMMQQHMGSGGPMGGWMGWGPWLLVLLVVLAAAVAALLVLLVSRRAGATGASAGPPSGPDPGQLVLGVVPEAESAVLKPVLEAPGISQPEVVHRSGYSKATVSQVLTALERRGLVYRVKEGKVFRVYPSKAVETGKPNGSEPK